MSHWKVFLFSGIPFLIAGCNVTIRKDFMESAMERVSFEMKCPKEQIQLAGLVGPLDTGYMMLGTGAQVGVSGCGQRAVYVRTGSGWILNSEMKPENPSAAPAQAAAPKTPSM